MIKITRLNEQEMFINSDLIEFMEATPDTTLSMTSGRKVIAKESTDEIVDLILEYKRRIIA